MNGILVCLCQIPVIQLLLAPGRGQEYPAGEDPLLFNRKGFCAVWTCVWWLVSQVSVVMVAVLSLARLYILKFTTKQIKPWIAYAVPGLFSICSLLYSIIRFGTKSGYPFFDRNRGKCYMTTIPLSAASQELESLNNTVSTKHLDGITNLLFIYNTPPIVMFCLVLTSFSASLFLLKKSAKASVRIGSKARQQREASKTVVIVTLIYIVCNIPFVGYLCGILYLYRVEILKDGAKGHIHVLEYLGYAEGIFPDNSFVRHYIAVVIDMFTVCLNSAINPLVYITRITLFRKNFENFPSTLSQVLSVIRYSTSTP